MRRIVVILMVLISLSVAGCEQLTKVAAGAARAMQDAFPHHPIAIVLPPGYPVSIDGKNMLVYGVNDCLAGDPMMNALFGPDPYAGESTCVVLAPQTDVVAVSLLDTKAGTMTHESWDVVRSGERRDAISLRRPNGTFVVSHEAFQKSKPAVLGMI